MALIKRLLFIVTVMWAASVFLSVLVNFAPPLYGIFIKMLGYYGYLDLREGVQIILAWWSVAMFLLLGVLWLLALSGRGPLKKTQSAIRFL